MKRTRQSNRVELCPACAKRLANRAAAASHYRAHVRDGSMVESGFYDSTVWKWDGLWFKHGVAEYFHASFEDSKAEWLKRQRGHQRLYRHLEAD